MDKALIDKWQSKLELKGWSFLIDEIQPEQVVYDNDCPVKDRYFVGIEIDKENNTNYSTLSILRKMKHG